MNEHLSVLHTYFDLVQVFSIDETAYAAVLHPDVEQLEFPNLLHKTIQRRSFDDIMANLRAGRELLRDPTFEVHSTQHCPDGSIIVEGRWQAITTNDIGQLLRGQRLSAQLCLIFEFQDGKIYRQRRYPCYDLA
ncbi:nuclear transport factor 2 family protein [Hymenobacter taeanensis]|uniref:Nuclear transport factor 2 family protein n=1 Tax=Hymenobacter taeanensis TaxID=2735321 RepID=A0A6M6BEK7_9BACT|nr:MULTISPECIES: nuclear transport factor 2 family protein [Hymenobacter]QJX46647.1 nuclear transport factor 2 family protein [Hymenobacter taeanensis]UOQ80511.1 nuclear transport factor 2 family protein [Hymenobacter sp. 5414T-23]